MLLIALFVAATSVVASPTPAAVAGQTSAPAQPTAIASANADKRDQIVCRYESVTGTRFKARHCMRQDQWDRLTGDSHSALIQLQNQGAPRCMTCQ